MQLSVLKNGIPQELPAYPELEDGVPQAPVRSVEMLSKEEFQLAVSNALRYFPSHLHETLAPEFSKELKTLGHIYMLR